MANSIVLPSSIRTPLSLHHSRNLTCSSSYFKDFSTIHKTRIKGNSVIRKTSKTLIEVPSSRNCTKVAVADVNGVGEISVRSASDIVRNFYGGINRNDLASVEDLIAENCVYEDLVFPRPFIGRKAILDFFKKFTNSISRDLQFVIDNISEEDSLAIGVTWHLEWRGKPFPFSRGCSFYRLEIVNGKKQIIYGRDSVEPSIKPGETALIAIKGVTWLLQRFPQLGDQL